MRSIPCCLCGIAIFSLVGCSQSSSPLGGGGVTPVDAAGVAGRVESGPQPVAHATIQLYTVGTLGDGSPATPLLTKTLTTDAQGNFSLAGLYSCSSTTQVYLTATGGEPTTGLTNANLAMMTALGSCSSLNASTFIQVNELTTVAAVSALSHYMAGYAALGSGVGDVDALNAAFTLASELADPATGAVPGQNVPNGFIVPVATINTLADIAASCIDSGGGAAGDGSACGNFFSLTAPAGAAAPHDTIMALVNLANHPGLNTGALYALSSAASPFQPRSAAAPPNLSVGLQSGTEADGLELTPASIAFPSTTVGTVFGGQAAWLTNSSTIAQPVIGFALGGADAGLFAQTNDCPATLPPGASCTALLSFTPPDTLNHSAALQVNAGSLSVALSGSGDLEKWESTLQAAHPSLYLNFNDATTSFLDSVSGLSFLPSNTGTILPRQPGFDVTQTGNMSASFSHDAYLYAPNQAIGDINWDQPFSLLLHIDKLQWARAGKKVLLSKGNLSGSYGARWYELTVGMDSAGRAQFCFTANGAGGDAAQPSVMQSVCTGLSNTPDFPNGYNYDLAVTGDGTGSPTGFNVFVNGIPAATHYSPAGLYGFGGAVVSLVGSGSGYADSTPFTSSGGGPNCHVSGTMNASGGVPTGVTTKSVDNYGCISTPTLTLTGAGGTGTSLTSQPYTATISTANTAALYISGSWSGTTAGATAGIGSDSMPNDPPVLIDEFAVFPAALTTPTVEKLYTETKFYQRVIDPVPATPHTVVFDNDGCADPDNLYALALTIAGQRLGYLNVVGVVDTDGSGVSTAMYRQMLDQAGLKQVPVSVPSSFGLTSSNICLASNIATYDAEKGTATPQMTSAYMPAATMYRNILAANPKTPVYIVLGGSFRGVSDLLQSPADGTSSLTGAQLMARNAVNGGSILAQGLAPNMTFSSDNSLEDWQAGQYVVTHNGNLPIYWYGGSPQSSGPNVLSTRNQDDPLFLMAASLGTDGRGAWDSLPVTSLLSSKFSQGVTVTVGGTGRGYADETAFTSTGGGDSCVVAGVMNSVQGVPSSVTFPTASANVLFSGLGSGCTSAPGIVLTAPTGTGAVLTAKPTMLCGTVTIASAKSLTTSTATCSQHYFVPYSLMADPGNPPVLQWFLNSLIGPPPEGQ